MYLEYFGLSEFPFALTHNENFFCTLDTYNSALNLIKISLENGEGFIKVIGEVGTGKTFLCRRLLNELDAKKYVTAYIPNPNLDHATLYEAILSELGVVYDKATKPYELLHILNLKLIELYKQHKNVVVVIDEAQGLADEILEAIRLLSNIETESNKLLHIVLFAQPELDKHLAKSNLRQLRQRIAFSYYLHPLTITELEDYICFRLQTAGYKYGKLFSCMALKLVHKATAGIPRLVNIICHKSLLAAYGYNEKKVTVKTILTAIKDTDSVLFLLNKSIRNSLLLVCLLAIFSVELYYVFRLTL